MFPKDFTRTCDACRDCDKGWEAEDKLDKLISLIWPTDLDIAGWTAERNGIYKKHADPLNIYYSCIDCCHTGDHPREIKHADWCGVLTLVKALLGDDYDR